MKYDKSNNLPNPIIFQKQAVQQAYTKPHKHHRNNNAKYELKYTLFAAARIGEIEIWHTRNGTCWWMCPEYKKEKLISSVEVVVTPQFFALQQQLLERSGYEYAK